MPYFQIMSDMTIWKLIFELCLISRLCRAWPIGPRTPSGNFFLNYALFPDYVRHKFITHRSQDTLPYNYFLNSALFPDYIGHDPQVPGHGMETIFLSMPYFQTMSGMTHRSQDTVWKAMGLFEKHRRGSLDNKIIVQRTSLILTWFYSTFD